MRELKKSVKEMERVSIGRSDLVLSVFFSYLAIMDPKIEISMFKLAHTNTECPKGNITTKS